VHQDAEQNEPDLEAEPVNVLQAVLQIVAGNFLAQVNLRAILNFTPWSELGPQG
jgi:hypothetical protein